MCSCVCVCVRVGVEFLQREGMLGSSPEEVAAFLTRTEGLEKTVIGDYLGERDDGCIKVGEITIAEHFR